MISSLEMFFKINAIGLKCCYIMQLYILLNMIGVSKMAVSIIFIYPRKCLFITVELHIYV